MRVLCSGIYCYACNSYLGQCGERVDNSKGTVFRSRCAGPCFARRGEDDGIRLTRSTSSARTPSVRFAADLLSDSCRPQQIRNKSTTSGTYSTSKTHNIMYVRRLVRVKTWCDKLTSCKRNPERIQQQIEPTEFEH